MKEADRKEHAKVQCRDGEISVASEELDASQADESEPWSNDPHQLDPEDLLVNAIERHLTSTVLMKTSHGGVSTPSASFASVPAESEEDLMNPSFSSSGGGDSTKERKGICITVVSRDSRFVSFPSSSAHTYMTFFHAALSKSQVDAVLEEQFLETREMLEDKREDESDSVQQQSKRRKRKYQGEYNEEGERHGYGIYRSKNGNEYRGEWHNNMREGLGVVKIGNGDVFEGQFEGNLKNGIGVYHFLDGECDLSRYKDDARDGDSLRYSKDRRSAFLISGDLPGRSKAISLEEAARIAKKMGAVVSN